MRLPTRRPAAWCLVLVVGLLTAIWPVLGPTRAEDSQPPEMEERLLLIGPLLLGDLYANMMDANAGFGDQLAKGSGLSNRRIVEALNSCRLYLIDRKRASKKGGEWTFGAYQSETRPKLLVEGQLMHELQTGEGKSFRLCLREASLADVNTESRIRWGTITVKLGTDWYEIERRLSGLVWVHRDMAFPTKPLVWNVEGKVEWMKPKNAQKP